MKNHRLFQTAITHSMILLIILLFCPSVSQGEWSEPPVKDFVVLVNDKPLDKKDSLEITMKGILKLGAFNELANKPETIGFKVVITHRSWAGNALNFPWVESYKNGEILDSINLDLILPNTKAGDTLTIIPVNKETKKADQEQKLEIKLIADQC